MIRNALIIIFIFVGLALARPAQAQIQRQQDLNGWGWVQLYKTIDTTKYVSLQYQVRFNNNVSTFQSNNFYFVGGINPTKNLNIEALYQINTNRFKDLNTFYAGITYRIKVNKKISFYVRTAYQYNQNHLFNPEFITHPYSEWRNRVRLKYRVNKRLNLAFSGEPTLHFNILQHQTYLDKIRFVSQATYQLNKYSSMTVFYMIQPQIEAYKGTPGTNYMMGLTYQINLPNKLKKFDNIFKLDKKGKKNEDNQQEEELDQKIPVFNSQL